MNDQQLLRYSRHILLPEIGVEGQEKLLAARALVIGAGGLGSPAAMYLASSGVGSLTVCDGDTVDLTNLQRQLLHRTSTIGQPKALSAKSALADINPEISIVTIPQRAEGLLLPELVANADIVLDCSDNFPTRYALNRVCLGLNKPLVSGAATRFDGQVSVFDFRKQTSPCYNCLYPEHHEAEETRCAVMGVFAPLVGTIGAMQAAEALKLLLGTGQPLSGRLLIMDMLNMEVRSARLAKDPACQACGLP
jgi:molybdopterin/thiamine biosynthesis adenylyltransferase